MVQTIRNLFPAKVEVVNKAEPQHEMQVNFTNNSPTTDNPMGKECPMRSTMVSMSIKQCKYQNGRRENIHVEASDALSYTLAETKHLAQAYKQRILGYRRKKTANNKICSIYVIFLETPCGKMGFPDYLHALVAAASMHLLTIRSSSARGRRFSQLWSTAIESARFRNTTSERKASVLETKLFSPKDSVISKYSAAHLKTATLEGVISKLMP